MKRAIQILDVFSTPKYGIILTGYNPELDDLSEEDIKSYIGEKILIQKPNGEEQIVDGVLVDIGTSLLGKKNVSIALPRSVQLSDVEARSMVFVAPD